MLKPNKVLARKKVVVMLTFKKVLRVLVVLFSGVYMEVSLVLLMF